MRFKATCYRAHDPQWSWAPTSGDGAAARGGRFNPIGVPALYLALTLEGMLVEMGHGFAHRFDPLTICSYAVDVNDVADLRTDAGRGAVGVDLADMASPWTFEAANRQAPRSWAVAKKLIAANHAGLLAPSFANGARPDATNLVLWRWGPARPHKVQVIDPEDRLPRDRSSWPTSTAS